MTRDERLAAIQYLSNDLQDHLLRGLIIELGVRRLAKSGGPTEQTLELATSLYLDGAPARNGHPLPYPAAHVIDGDAEEPKARRGRPAKAALPPPSPGIHIKKGSRQYHNAKCKDDPRNTAAWVEDLVRFAFAHNNELLLDVYHQESFRQNYPDTKVSHTRFASSLNYASASLKLLKRQGYKRYELTAKGRQYAESLAQAKPSEGAQSTGEAQTEPVATQPELFGEHQKKEIRPGRAATALRRRMVDYATQHGGRLDAAGFKEAERQAGRSAPGGAAYNVLRNPSIFKATDTPGIFELVPGAATAGEPAPIGEHEPDLADAIRSYVSAHEEINLELFRKEYERHWRKRTGSMKARVATTARNLVRAGELRRLKPNILKIDPDFKKSMAAGA